jgi:hypothetical protein
LIFVWLILRRKSLNYVSDLILPPFRESTLAKKAIAQNVTFRDLGKPDLLYPFEQLITKLESINERSLSTVG